jgi:hypothetical protein
LSLNAEFIPEPTSSLQFHEYFRRLFNVTRLSAEISTDGGNQLIEIYGRHGSYNCAAGANYTNSGWDAAWNLRTISLAPGPVSRCACVSCCVPAASHLMAPISIMGVNFTTSP